MNDLDQYEKEVIVRALVLWQAVLDGQSALLCNYRAAGSASIAMEDESESIEKIIKKLVKK